MTKTKLKILKLDVLTQGVTYLLVITQCPGAHTLKFMHLDDPTPALLPSYGTNNTVGTVVAQFVCPAPRMLIEFANTPTQDYHVSVTPVSAPEF